jgi:pimeloyl-ACP methyl ester carboxylesterase
MKVNGQSEQQIQAQLEALKQQFARVRSGEAKDDEMISIASARYWRDLLAHDVPGALKKLSQPILVLRGESDVQISRVDYDEILKALAGRPPAQLEAHSFPGLNHLFMNAPKQATGGEYAIAGHVDAQAINIMTLWIKKQAAAAGATAR